MVRVFLPLVAVAVVAALPVLAAQTPAPFPRPGEPQRPQAPSSQQPPTAKPSAPPERTAAAPPPQPGQTPDQATLGLPVFADAQFIISYDAGRNQRYYLFGSNASFAEIVAFYKSALKQRGDLVFEEPPIHQFDVGRFREETMAFPPGVTVKDYASAGRPGYLNPKRGADPARFKTIIQIVPAAVVQ